MSVEVGRDMAPILGPARSEESIFGSLQAMAADDVRWDEGRVFSLAYDAGPQVRKVAERAYAMFSSANALNTDAFPSLRTMQAEVIAIVQGWLRAPASAAGFMTSGGTESILMAVKAARQRGLVERGITHPNFVLPVSAHAAFDKAAHYFGLECRRSPVGPDWRADPSAMADAIDDDTVLLVGSAPQYPQGVIDPIADIASIGRSRNVNVHVDACMGGVTLPFLERLGEKLPLWDFRLDGVTSISVDLHKYGYTSKGSSVVVYRDRIQRSYQPFVTDAWLGGIYGSSGMLGTKSGGPIAAAWAVMHFLGDEGYERLTGDARRTCLRLADAIADVPELALRARPDSTLVSFGIRPGCNVDIDAVAGRLRLAGWYVDRQGPPPSLHCTVHAGHGATIEEFIVALRQAVSASTGTSPVSEFDPGSYGTIE